MTYLRWTDLQRAGRNLVETVARVWLALTEQRLHAEHDASVTHDDHKSDELCNPHEWHDDGNSAASGTSGRAEPPVAASELAPYIESSAVRPANFSSDGSHTDASAFLPWISP